MFWFPSLMLLWCCVPSRRSYYVQVGRFEKTCELGYATRVLSFEQYLYYCSLLLVWSPVAAFFLLMFQLLAFWHVLNGVLAELAPNTAAVIGVIVRRYTMNNLHP